MAVGNQLAIQGQHTAALVAAQAQGFQAELHAQAALIVEKGFANALGRAQLLQHIGTHQVTALVSGAQRVEVVPDEHIQVAILELLQTPPGAEESLEILQRGIVAGGAEGVATVSALSSIYPKCKNKNAARLSGVPERNGAGNETRTRDPDLGKVVLYQLSYSR
jgi:hypothetical protein